MKRPTIKAMTAGLKMAGWNPMNPELDWVSVHDIACDLLDRLNDQPTGMCGDEWSARMSDVAEDVTDHYLNRPCMVIK